MLPYPPASGSSFAEPHFASNGVPIISVPQWKAHPWLWHGFSTRIGGVTRAYSPEGAPGELNLGFTADDDRENVLHNRRLLAEAVSGSADTPIVTVRQVHSATVILAEQGHTAQPVCEGDGLLTRQSGILLGVQTADCIPVLVADCKRKAVGAFHAGWRGTVKGIVQDGVGRMRREFGSQLEDLTAAIGPAIGPCCYTVGDEVRSAFKSRFAYAPEFFHRAGDSLQLDLFEANRRQLLDAGLEPESIHLAGGCTACQPQIFFSHRAGRGRAGRMLSIIGIRCV